MPADGRDMVLVPCPFCGGNAAVMRNGCWQASCTECHAGTPMAFETAEMAASAWNRRASPARGEGDTPVAWRVVSPSGEEHGLFYHHGEAKANAQPGDTVKPLYGHPTPATPAGLREALARQTENMAFILNRVEIPPAWLEKFDRELDEDRAALSTPSTTSTAGEDFFAPFEAYRAPSPGEGDAPVAAEWAARVMEVRQEGDGSWVPCSGCQEGVDGYVSQKDYPYSAAFGCQPGGGCSECGGLGVLWDTTDWDEAARFMLADMEAEEAHPTPATPAGEELRPFGLSPLEIERIRSVLIAGLEKTYWAGSEVSQGYDAAKEADAILAALQPQAEGGSG